MPRTVKRARPKRSWTGAMIGAQTFDLDPGEVTLPSLTALDTGQYSGTFDFEVVAKVKNTLSFASGTKRITDSANQMTQIKTGDTIRVVGSVSNDGLYKVATGSIAGYCVVNEALVDEVAGAWIQLHKKASLSNNCVYDRRTGLIWAKNCMPNTLGVTGYYCFATGGTLNVVTAHAADGNVGFDAPTCTFRVVGGAGELPKYRAGMTIGASGFTNPHTNLLGYPILSVAVDGADLLIQVKDIGQTKVTEAPGGSRALLLGMSTFQSVLSWANTYGFAGHYDWRVPSAQEFLSLVNFSNYYCVPSGFASIAGIALWTTTPSYQLAGRLLNFMFNTDGPLFGTTALSTGSQYLILVRGRP